MDSRYAHADNGLQLQYLIRFKGYEHPDWVSADNMDAPILVEDYWRTKHEQDAQKAKESKYFLENEPPRERSS